MMFSQSSAPRLLAIVVVLLSLGLLVSASPVAAPVLRADVISAEVRNQRCYGGYCYGGLDLMSLLLQLQQAVEFKLALLGMSTASTYSVDLLSKHTDDCLTGGDYASLIIEIEGMILAANGAIRGYKIGLIELLTGKLLAIAKIWVAIVIVCAIATFQVLLYSLFTP